MQQTFTREEVVQLLLDERQRGIDIAYSFKKKYEDEVESYNKINDSINDNVIYINKQRAEVCRKIGNSITGVNSIGAVLGYTEKESIETGLK